MCNIFSHNRQTNNLSIMAVNVRSQAQPRLDDGCKSIQQRTFSSLQEASVNMLIGDEAAEYKFDLLNGQVIDDNKYSFACLPDNPILIEMSYIQESRNIEESIFDLQVKGYQSILAHPERFVRHYQGPKRTQRFKNLACLLQTNLLSELGYYGLRKKQVAQGLLHRGVIDFVPTDVQHENHVKKSNIKAAALFTCKT